MAAITVTALNVDALNGAVIRRGTAGATITPGQAVYLDGANGWKLADADAEASSQARGIALADQYGSVSFPSGTVIDIVVFGPVEGFTGMTPGAALFASVTAGALDETAPSASGDYPFVVGFAESATVAFVNPQSVVPTVNP